MPSLDSLNLPSLSTSVLAFFSEVGIATVEDFLVHDIYSLVALAGHQSDGDQYKQAVVDILLCLEEDHAVWLDGMDLLNLMQQTVSFLPTGCKSFDDILLGGLRDGTVTELFGPSSSGKTQICIQTAANAALHSTMVVYIDTCNSFSPSRLAEVFCGILDSKKSQHLVQARNDLEDALKLVLCYRVHDVFSLLALLHQMDASFTTGLEGNEGVYAFRNARLIILDSVSSVVAPVLSNNHVQGHALMMKCGQTLKKIAVENNLCVLLIRSIISSYQRKIGFQPRPIRCGDCTSLNHGGKKLLCVVGSLNSLTKVTNHTVAGENRAPKPALGESWKVAASVRLLVSREPGTDICSVSVVKHSSMRCNKQVYFRLSTAGMQPL